MMSCPLFYYFCSSIRRWNFEGWKTRGLCMACWDKCTKYLYALWHLYCCYNSSV